MRDWALPSEVPLTARAAERVAREATAQAFDPAARVLSWDWGRTLEGKQAQRWGEALGRRVQAARAALGRDTPGAAVWARQLKEALWDGQVASVIAALQAQAQRLGPPQEADGPEHPRRVLANNVGYFQTHRPHMDYPTYRRNGWPIGSGVTEAAVKQFNKRVKGTEQFWSLPGVEAILSLRALWLSQDDRWRRYWDTRPGYPKAA